MSPAERSRAPGARPARRDALRNDAKVLEAARAVLGEHGAAASIEQIADRAGVGVASIYRRFASKDVLIQTLVLNWAQELQDRADAILLDDDGSGLEVFLAELGASLVKHRNYGRLLRDLASDPAPAYRFRDRLDRLTQSAVAAGRLPREVATGDIMSLVWALAAVVETTADAAPSAWRRFLDIHLRGLRRGGSALEGTALSQSDMAALSPIRSGHVEG